LVIHTFEHEYPVTFVKEISDTREIYICRNAAKGGLCRILAISDRGLFPGILPGLSDAAQSTSFTDFIEHFMFDDALCIVMKYTQGVTLRDKLATESLSLPEKLEIGRRILERMILQELPDYYLAGCCVPENIIVDSDMTLHFNYDIEDIERQSTCTRADSMAKIDALLRFIFRKEAEDYSSAEVTQFLTDLPLLTTECDLIGLYSAYHEMMQKAVSADARESEPSIWHKLWEKIKAGFKVLRKILLVLLLIAAAVYLIYTIGDTKDTGARHLNFDQIGSVQIK